MVHLIILGEFKKYTFYWKGGNKKINIKLISKDLRKASVNVGTRENPIYVHNTVAIWKHWRKKLSEEAGNI